MARLQRAGGLRAGERWIQFVPSHSQVSERKPAAPHPPKRTARPRAESYARAWPERGAGLAAGEGWDQVVPSHSQVSDRKRPVQPPKRTTRPRAESYAMACEPRAGGLVFCER